MSAADGLLLAVLRAAEGKQKDTKKGRCDLWESCVWEGWLSHKTAPTAHKVPVLSNVINTATTVVGASSEPTRYFKASGAPNQGFF